MKGLGDIQIGRPLGRQGEGAGLNGFLLVASQPCEAVGEGVGDAEFYLVANEDFAVALRWITTEPIQHAERSEQLALSVRLSPSQDRVRTMAIP